VPKGKDGAPPPSNIGKQPCFSH